MKQKINLTIKGEQLKKKLNIKDGKTPVKGVDYFDGQDAVVDYDKVVNETTTQIKPLIPKPEDLIATVEDDLTKKLPQYGVEFRDGLELLTGNDRLDKSAIRGLDDYEEIAKLAKEKSQEITKIIGGGAGIQNLQQVTDNGNTTTKDITVSGITKTQPFTLSYTSGALTNITYNNGGQKNFTYNGDGTLATMTISSPNHSTITKTFSYTSGALTGVNIT